MMKTSLVSLLLLLNVLNLGACSVPKSKTEKPGVKFSEVYGPVKPSRTLNREVALADFKTSLGTGRGVHGARFIEVFRSEGGPPEWRIFDVHPGDPYGLIGVEDGDILVAANDWMIFDPQRFRAYVELLPSGFDASIFLRRAGILIELQPEMAGGSPSESAAP
jgi:hypothetical protein